MQKLLLAADTGTMSPIKKNWMYMVGVPNLQSVNSMSYSSMMVSLTPQYFLETYCL
jgi:hypothetical protein